MTTWPEVGLWPLGPLHMALLPNFGPSSYIDMPNLQLGDSYHHKADCSSNLHVCLEPTVASIFLDFATSKHVDWQHLVLDQVNDSSGPFIVLFLTHPGS